MQGFEPDHVKERYKMAIMRGNIQFSPRNFAWKNIRINLINTEIVKNLNQKNIIENI